MLTLNALPPTSRVSRRPKHTFQVRHKPMVIQPFMIAPVLPAETLESAMIQCRAVSRPLRSSIIGWTLQHYIFYVKIRDLNERDQLDDLFINPTANVSALNTAADVPTYHPGNSPNYTSMCLRRVVETYFRNEGEAWNNANIDGLPTASILDQKWMDSLIDTTALPEGGTITGTGEAVDRLMDAYEYLRGMNLTSMSFEDYCKTFGVTLAKSEINKPELLMRSSEWTLPSNTVEPTTGVPSSAASWVAEAMSRDKKFFKEPGFLFGVTVAKPKVYFANLRGSLAHYLDQGLSWLPAIMRDSPETSLREFAAATGPIAGPPTNGYWVDMRDLFLYGDQFVNFALSALDDHSVALPTAALLRRFMSTGDIDSFFPGTDKTIIQDGVVSLSIKGMERDYTATIDR